MEALLIKNDEWDYVNGTSVKPEPSASDSASAARIAAWIKRDSKAKSDIVLSIGSSELKQIKGCITLHAVWLKLESVYQSRGPARKATLLKQLMLHRMEDGGDVREHIGRFFDAVDKLKDMEVDVLAIALLYSLPPSFDNFRMAIESRDNLPDPEALRIKIIEEHDARRNEQSSSSDAMFTNKKQQGKKNPDRNKLKGSRGKKTKAKCSTCHLFGHEKAQCRKNSKKPTVSNAEQVSLCIGEALLVKADSQAKKWCLNSGATTHLCNDIALLTHTDFTKRGILNLANSDSTNIQAEGTARLAADVFGNVKDVSLRNILLVPDLRTNLISVGKITDQGFKVYFFRNTASVTDPGGSVKLVADKVNGLYYVRESGESTYAITESGIFPKTTSETRHSRLGHLNIQDLRKAERNGTVRGLRREDLGDDRSCEVCTRAKMSKMPFAKQSSRKSTLLDIVHSDICGPLRVPSISGARYFVEFIDDHSRCCEMRFLKSKDEVIKATKDYIALVENQKERSLKCLQTDNGREYLNSNFESYLKSRGITRRLTIPYNLQQNGIAERKNRTLMDTARCLLFQSGLPSKFWAEAVNTANYIRNRCPTRSLGGKTPYEYWNGEIPDVSHRREFGAKNSLS